MDPNYILNTHCKDLYHMYFGCKHFMNMKYIKHNCLYEKEQLYTCLKKHTYK